MIKRANLSPNTFEMKWEKLLSLKRYGDQGIRHRVAQQETRLGFEVDYDRIIFSSTFRSLQDKTQVIPLSKLDFVHTRLTHSLEVSVVGRSLGRIVGDKLLQKHPYLSENLGYRFGDFGAIVAAAALSHDIGNPPFGHSGEKAIGEYFSHGKGKKYKDLISPKEYQDLISFEGNANGFRLLAASREGVDGGLRLSYATLGAFMKYPKESLPKKPTKYIGDKKFGYFQAEKHLFQDVAEELGLQARGQGKSISYCRHPLAFLVEAADDICYTIIDFEDGINLGLVPEEYALEYLINLVKDTINTAKYNTLNLMSDRLSYLRALAINTLINDAADVFLKNEEDILEGSFQDSLLDHSKYKAQTKDIIKLSVDHIYMSKGVVNKEIAGYRLIRDLLEAFTPALIRNMEGKASSYDRLLLATLPENYKDENASVYQNLLNASCFVASLSDSTAVYIHNKISGKDL